MSMFKKLFERYGFEVEQWSEDSYIADNGIYCVPFTEYIRYGKPEMWAITIDSCHKEELKELFKYEDQIGCMAWCRGVPFPIHRDLICNHDCMYFETEGALKLMTREK